MPPTPIYLDHNATTPTLPEVAEAVHSCLREIHASPNSQHAAGRVARRRLETARFRIATLLGADATGRPADRLVLTSGGTESNNLVLRALCRGRQGDAHLVISAIEHPSIDATAEQLEAEGVIVDRLPVDARGVVRIDALEALLRPSTRLVSVMLANNETGVVQPVVEIARRCAARGVPVHTDATQVVGKAAVDFRSLGVHLLTFAAHKFHGPPGVGGLVVRHDVPPLVGFGGQSGAERPGTPAVPLAVGMHVALERWHAEARARGERMRGLRDRFERLIDEADRRVVVVGGDADRLPHTSNLAFVGLDRQALAMAFDRAGVQCSTGSACASGSGEPSPALRAMALPDAVVRGAVRFSLGALTTVHEVDEAAARIGMVCRRLRAEDDR